MIVCPQCHHHNEDRTRFCPQCGTSLHTLSDDEKNAERLKEQSRELARGDRSPLAVSLRRMGLPHRKGYPVLSFISTVMFVGGCILIIVGLIGFQASWFDPSSDAPRGDTTTALAYIVGGGASKLLSGLAIYIGVGYIANAELLKLYMDLQENADRQSLLLTIVLDRMKEKET